MSARTILIKGAAAGAAAFMLAAVSAGPAIAAAPSAHIDAVDVTPGHVEMTLTTSNLPAGVELDSASVTLTADGAELPARISSRGRTKTTARTSARTVVMLLDTSGSMSAADIAAARQAALAYARSLPEDVRVGLITFADKPTLVVKPRENRAALAAGLNGLKSGGNTTLYDAVRLGVSTLDGLSDSATRRLVVLSDGVDTSSRTSLAAVTKSLADKKVAADVVAFQYDEGDTSAVKQLAKANGGRVIAADDASQLSAAFTAIARNFTERVLIGADVPAELAGKSAVVKVEVSTDAGAFSASKRVTFAAAGVPAASNADSESGWAWLYTWVLTWSWQLWLVAGLTFTAVLLVALVLFGVGRSDDNGKRVLDQISRYGPQRDTTRPERAQENSLARTAVGWTEDVLRSRGWEEKLAARLDLAAIKLKPAEWTLLRICTSVVAAGLLMLLGVNFLVAVVLGVALGWAGTMLLVKFRISRRRAAFADQLPDVLQLVAGSLKSGFSLTQALDSVVREDTQPSAGEISRALAETRIGVELEDALDRVALRMASDDLKWIVMAIRIQREVGGNLAEVLLTTVSTMRERAQTRRQVRALSAEGRLSAYVLLGLPFAMAAYFLVVRAEYVRPLYTTFPGIAMLVGAAVFMVLGSFWMSRIVKVEV